MNERRPKGYWKQLGNYEIEVKELWNMHPELRGTIPSTWWMNKNRYSFLAVQISHYPGGIASLRKHLECNVETLTRPEGYWKIWENVEKETREVTEILGHFPKTKELHAIGRSSLSIGFKNFGGAYVVRKKLKLGEFVAKNQNYWKELNNMKQELEHIWDTHPCTKGTLPSSWWLNKQGYAYYVGAIHNNYGGFPKFRKLLGMKEKPDVVEKYRKYSTLKEAKYALQEVWKKYPEMAGLVPPSNWLRVHGYVTLDGAISKYHLGSIQLRKRLNIASSPRTNRYKKGELREWGRLEKEIEIILKENPDLKGYFPTVPWLLEQGYYAVYSAIRSFGGVRAVREKFYLNRGQTTEKECLESLLRGYIGESYDSSNPS